MLTGQKTSKQAVTVVESTVHERSAHGPSIGDRIRKLHEYHKRNVTIHMLLYQSGLVFAYPDIRYPDIHYPDIRIYPLILWQPKIRIS